MVDEQRLKNFLNNLRDELLAKIKTKNKDLSPKVYLELNKLFYNFLPRARDWRYPYCSKETKERLIKEAYEAGKGSLSWAAKQALANYLGIKLPKPPLKLDTLDLPEEVKKELKRLLRLAKEEKKQPIKEEPIFLLKAVKKHLLSPLRQVLSTPRKELFDRMLDKGFPPLFRFYYPLEANFTKQADDFFLFFWKTVGEGRPTWDNTVDYNLYSPYKPDIYKPDHYLPYWQLLQAHANTVMLYCEKKKSKKEVINKLLPFYRRLKDVVDYVEPAARRGANRPALGSLRLQWLHLIELTLKFYGYEKQLFKVAWCFFNDLGELNIKQGRLKRRDLRALIKKHEEIKKKEEML